MKKSLCRFGLSVSLFLSLVSAQGQSKYLLEADRIFDGQQLHTGWVVLVENNLITAVGPPSQVSIPSDAVRLKFPGCTLLPGLIEGHSHLLLHPYNETSWDDQVLKESDALRVARATVHAKKTLQAGFTTVRDLGSEGAGYSDVGLKKAILQGIIPGPRMIVAGPAIVATGSYGPKGFDTDFNVMLGAEQADGNTIVRVVRDQIGKGADVIKVYADYRWGVSNEARPTFSVDELKLAVETAESSGRPVVAHATTAEGMRRATLAGVETIEHGDNGTLEIFQLMKERGVALCPTLTADEAISEYRGWKKGSTPEPATIKEKRESFALALKAGVTICAGSDVGVFAHGLNARELELMVEFGMSPVDVLKSATSINAKVFHLEKETGRLVKGLQADIIAVKGDPTKDVTALRAIEWIMKSGIIVDK
ncbi:MAG TPA: amidohydrolase family protein [Chryseolinea sp.]|nr:amidohydrolase family protein [Chryseolinea sp.]